MMERSLKELPEANRVDCRVRTASLAEGGARHGFPENRDAA